MRKLILNKLQHHKMKKGNNHSQESIIQKTLRTSGFIFPETPEEVNEFENQFGTTDVDVPNQLKDLSFMDNRTSSKLSKVLDNKFSITNLAMVARGGMELPNDIIEKMKNDRESIKKKKR